MTSEKKERISIWCIATVIALLFLWISSCTSKDENPNRTTILMYAPETMVEAFQGTFEVLKLDKDYIIEGTDDINEANFIVREGMNKEGKLFAYSPIVAVFNSDTEYMNSLIEKEIFVTSELETDEYDFDFNKIIQQILTGKECEFKVYYPSKDSDSWDEFYSFMLFTVNDGYYPNTGEEMEQAKKVVEEFFNSKNAEPFNNNTIERSHGIAKNSIYFMAYADLSRVYSQSGGFSCRIMYPKTVVYHSYYATYDELGKLIYDSLEQDDNSFLAPESHKRNIGYMYLRGNGYNTKYTSHVSGIGQNVYGKRETFNGVEIPGEEISIYEEDQEQ